jgi:nucleolar protein 14
MNGIPEQNQRQRPSRKAQADDLSQDLYTSGPTQEEALVYKDGVLQNAEVFFSQGRGPQMEQESDSYSDGSDEEEDPEVALDDDELTTIGHDEYRNTHGASSNAGSDDDESDLASESSKASEASEASADDDNGSFGISNKSSGITASKEELPFTFECPDTLQEFESLCAERPLSDVLIIIERLRILYNAKLAPENKKKMQKLTIILFDYFGTIPETHLTSSFIDGFTRHLAEVAAAFPEKVARYSKRRIEKMQSKVSKDRLKKRVVMPTLHELLFMRFMCQMYPGSDQVHGIMTPLTVLMGDLLMFAKVKEYTDIATGLFMCDMILNAQRLSKRYAPEVITFLYSILHMFQDPQYQVTASDILIRSKMKGCHVYLEAKPSSLLLLMLTSSEYPAEWISGLFMGTLHVVEGFAKLYMHLETFIETFTLFSQVLEQVLKIEKVHSDIKVF